MTRPLAAAFTWVLRALLRAALVSMLLFAHPQTSARAASCSPDSALPESVVTRADVENAIAFRFGAEPPIVEEQPVPGDEPADRPMSNQSRFDMGAAYLTGKNTRRDANRAFAWFLSAAEQGDVEASMIVAYLYATGTGTPANCREATKWLCRAGDSGIEEVKYAMGTRCSSADEPDSHSPSAKR